MQCSISFSLVTFFFPWSFFFVVVVILLSIHCSPSISLYAALCVAFHLQTVYRFYCYDGLINICEPYLFVFRLNATAIAANIFKHGDGNTSIVFTVSYVSMQGEHVIFLSLYVSLVPFSLLSSSALYELSVFYLFSFYNQIDYVSEAETCRELPEKCK